jgi:hypothetical protein
MIPKKPAPHFDAGWGPVSRLREARAPVVVWLDASPGEARSDKIMRQQEV